MFDYIVTSELHRQIKCMIEQRLYNTQFHMSISTSREDQKLQTSSRTMVGAKSFGFPIFLKGELRTVSNRTYLIDMEQNACDIMQHVSVTGGTIKHVNGSGILHQGEELTERRIIVTVLGSKDQDTVKVSDLERHNGHIHAEEGEYYKGEENDDGVLIRIGNCS